MKFFFYFLALLLVFISPFIGESSIDISKLFDSSSTVNMIFWQLRVPRIVLAFFVGGILSLSGLVFQTVFKNILITPYTLGIASGTTLFTAVSIVFLPSLALYISGIAGSFVTIMILYLISKVINKNLMLASTNSILLVGIALSFFYSSALMLIFYLSSLQENYTIVRFTLGSLDIVGFNTPLVVLGVAIVFLLAILNYKKELKLLLVSNDMAFLKGLNVNKVNLTLLILVSIAVGVSISFVGPIGFIGLVIPHTIRLIYKKSADNLIFPVFFYGGVFLVFSDLIARNLNTASSLPIGVVTSFIGAPFFVYLLIRRNNKKKQD
ncbi:FecCD family ABC transporter permease [Halarcobacter anaerophilus]|uniref:Iron ABC transporter permease n=1 Tax=Halarcobacter anaerophilus TaxID=877500 RepID=A0A4Q0Y2R3_9BACT|nr:iron ABC transporter permease [Halarcobacter anaerophilus]QDF29133.1 iron siderophore ABC transporter, permease protein [Halarcobacter anaerophilus]RXJ64390.1 iron ABC transporter permease [Halarcobacter anaerophilus]